MNIGNQKEYWDKVADKKEFTPILKKLLISSFSNRNYV